MSHKKLTVAELIKQKKVLGGNTAELYVERLDSVIVVKKPDIDFVMELTEMEDMLKASKELVYTCVVEPSLKDSLLQAEYECVEPFDIVYKVFTPGEVNSISEELFAMSGMNDKVKVVEKVKN